MASFQKKSKLISVPGTKISVHNSILLTSSGISSLDEIVGGGLPVGSILLIEDEHNCYGDLFLKLFLAEGVEHKHLLLNASLDENPELLFNSLPKKVSQERNESSGSSDNLKIAWRYKNIKELSKCEHFNLKHNIDRKDLTKELIFTWGTISTHSDSHNYYNELLVKIRDSINYYDLSTSSVTLKKNLLRIAISKFGSPFWGWDYSKNGSYMPSFEICSFMYFLRALMRSSFSVAVVTVPSEVLLHPVYGLRMLQHVDFVLKITSFQGSKLEKDNYFRHYNGLLTVKKLSAINSLVSNKLETCKWLFYIKQHQLNLEKFCLPPDLSDTASRQQDSALKLIEECSSLHKELF